MLDLAIFLIGVALALLGIFVPVRYPDMPTWLSSGGIYLGVALVALAMGFYLGDRRAAAPKTLANDAELRLRAYGDERTPERISHVNIWRWYYLRNIFVKINLETGEQTPHVLVNLFVTFDKPVNVGSLLVSSPDVRVPKHEVKEFNNRFAVIVFNDELPAGTIVLRVHQ